MKRFSISMVLGLALCAFVFCLTGCSHPGQTNAEVHRQHIRNTRINQQEMMEDIDKVMLFDKPSKLTDKRIP